MKLNILLVLLNLLYVNGQLSEEFVQEQWQTFRNKFNRNYKSAIEEDFRYKIFMDNLIEIEQHNQEYNNGHVNYFMSVNQFTDKLYTEYLKIISCARLVDNNNTQLFGDKDDYEENEEEFDDLKELPNEVDWVAKGAVTNIKHQGEVCGACYAFASVAALESSNYKKHGKLINLSPQNIVDCSKKYGNDGCDGGFSYRAFNYIKKFGVNTEQNYPYKGKDGKCKYNSKAYNVKITSYKKLKKGSESTLKNFVAINGPVAVDIDAGRKSFKNYGGGIYHEPKCKKNTNHVVVVVGYGTKKGKDYWKIKNSWGTEWGIRGYALMSRNRNNECGIASDPVYPYAK